MKKIPSSAKWIDASMIRKFLTKRPKNIHKGAAGRVLIVAGSSSMPGAGYLSAISALRAGAGLVVWALPQETYQKLDLRFPEVILQPLPSKDGKFSPEAIHELKKILPRFQTLAVGPGLGQGVGLTKFFEGLLKISFPAKVFDADALNLLAANPRWLKFCRGAIMTPHAQEMARLVKKNVKTVLAHRIGVAKTFAKRHKTWLILKGYRSVIASPNGKIFINSTGGPNLATAGSGDVLTGIIAGFLAQGLTKQEALLSAVYCHGLAGDILARVYGDRGTLASDIAKALPQAIKELIG